ncbi:MAG: AAA family ATPase [Hahellaceae bacterium]|nr:AAA family ATPase [Hahellaceae bacterium]
MKVFQAVPKSVVDHAVYYIETLGVGLCRFSSNTKGPNQVGWNSPALYIDTVGKALSEISESNNIGGIHAASKTACIDVDHLAWAVVMFQEFGLDLMSFLGQGLQITSGRPNRAKALFRIPDSLTGCTMFKVSWPNPDTGENECVIEFRIGNVQDVLPPSIHPDTGKPYQWVVPPWEMGGVIPDMPHELVQLFLHKDKFRQQLIDACPWVKDKPSIKVPKSEQPKQHNNVISKFNEAHDLGAMLEAHGYTRKGKRYLAPNSGTRIAGVIIFEDGEHFYSHHGSDIFGDGKRHDAFDIYCQYSHHGNVKSAVKGAAQMLGLTKQQHTGGEYNYESAVTELNPLAVAVDNWANFEPMGIDDDLMSQVSAIPKRRWLIQSHYLRGYVSATFAPGGVGKSMFQLTMAVSVATGEDLLGLGVEESAPVMVINNEDDYDEMLRRLAGILAHYQIASAKLKGRLFMLSGYGQPFTIASRLSDGTIIASPESEKLTAFIKDKNIGLVCLDPFISTHESEENANTEINKVISQYKHIAHETQCAISLIHHTAKSGQDSEAHAGDANSGRGASSLKDAARCVDTLAKMNQDTASKLNIEPDERPRYIRLDNGKLNFALGLGDAQWFYMNSVKIPNGDFVGVPSPVELGHLFERSEQTDKRVKWSATMVAEAFNSLMPKGVDSVPFSDIKANFMSRYDIADRQAREKSTMISASEKEPTRIKVHSEYVDFWYSKEKATSPVIIHRAYR